MNFPENFENLIADITTGKTEEVSMVCWHLGDHHVLKLADALKSDACKVKVCRLGHNRIGEVGATAIAESLTRFSSLTELYLPGIYFKQS